MALLSLKKKTNTAPAVAPVEEEKIQYLASPFDELGNTRLLVQFDDTVPVPTSTQTPQAQPLKLVDSDMLIGVVLQETASITFSQPAGAAAVTWADPDAPYSHLANCLFRVGGTVPLVDVSGRDLRLWALEAYPDMQDDTTYAPLPGANTGTSTVTTTYTYQILYWVPVAALLDWPMGMLLLANKGVTATIQTTWAPWASLMNLGSGSTATTITINSDTVQAYGVRQLYPADPAAVPADLLMFSHTLIAVKKPLSASTARIDFADSITGDLMRLGVVIENASGLRDVQNALGLTKVRLLTNGKNVDIDVTPSVSTFLRNIRARRLAGANLVNVEEGIATYGTDGAIWMGLDVGGGRNWLPSSKLSAARLELEFASAPPSGSQAVLLLEQLQQLVLTTGQAG